MAKERTGGAGIDPVLDMVGGDYIHRNIDCLAPKGRLVNLYYLQGSKVEVDMMPVRVKSLILTGSQLRPQPLVVKAEIGTGPAQNAPAPFSSATQPGQQILVDRLGLGRGHAMREARIGNQRAILQQLR